MLRGLKRRRRVTDVPGGSSRFLGKGAMGRSGPALLGAVAFAVLVGCGVAPASHGALATPPHHSVPSTTPSPRPSAAPTGPPAPTAPQLHGTDAWKPTR